MSIKTKYVTSVTQSANFKYTIEYYPITDDEVYYGIKSILYENNELLYTEILNLHLQKSKVEELIELCCTETVFPYTIIDIAKDMKIIA